MSAPLQTDDSGSRLLRELLHPPDSVLIDAGAEGEWLVARLRILLGLLLVGLIAMHIDDEPDVAQHLAGAAVAMTAAVLGAIVYAVLLHVGYRVWLGFATSILDVALISIALFSYVAVGTPEAVVDSPAAFEFYFLAIAATGLRYDRRVCLVAGGLAVILYWLVVSYAMDRWAASGATVELVEWPHQIIRLVLLTAMTVLSWESVRRAQRLRRQSILDRLTGLLNRAYFDDRVQVEMSRAERYGHPLALALIDLDRFKRVNDTLGHAAGDEVLRTFATTLRSSFRASDIVSRYGGEEFVVLLPEATAVEAIAKIDSLRDAFAHVPVALRDTTDPVQLTFTAGVAAYPRDGADPESLLHAADVRLLRGKQEGRNRVVGSEGPASGG